MIQRGRLLEAILQDLYGPQRSLASGLLPRNVAVPEWLLFGMGSFFETPLQSPWAGIGAPSAVNISSSPRGERVAVVNFSQGARAGIYTFTAGRLTSVERGAEPVAAPKPEKPKKKKPAAPAPESPRPRHGARRPRYKG